MHPYKRRTIPYKILFYLLYGSQDFILRKENREIVLSTGPLARALRISNSRLYGALDYLQALGIISQLDKLKKGTVSLIIEEPLI